MKKIALFTAALVLGFSAHAASSQAVMPKKAPLKEDARKADVSQNGPSNGCKNSAFGQTRAEPHSQGRACGNVSKS